MKFDPSKIIENPTSLPDGEYRVGDFFNKELGGNLAHPCVIEGGILSTPEGDIFGCPLISDWRYYYPVSVISRNTHRTKHRRILAPLWERCKR